MVLRPARSKLTESLNPKGDNRVKVPKADIQPNGRYGGKTRFLLMSVPLLRL